MFAPRVVVLALLFACLGAAQYAWDFLAIWSAPQPPASLTDAAARFWFDVTKTDWRDTMVLNVPASMLPDHLRMYWFDLRQQFGPVLPAVAVIGLAWLLSQRLAAWRPPAPRVPRLGALRLRLQRRRHARLLSAGSPVRRAAARGGASRIGGFHASGARRPEGLHYGGILKSVLALAIGCYGIVRILPRLPGARSQPRHAAGGRDDEPHRRSLGPARD